MNDQLLMLVQYLLGVSIVGFTYFIGRLLFSFWFYTIDEHIFLGFGRKLFGFRYKGVEVSVGVFIPLPWIAKMYAVVDGEKHKLGLPWEFHQTAIWKRLVATFGGMITSMIVGIVVFIFLSYLQKETYYSRDQIIQYGVYPGDFGKQVGFESGDKILNLNGSKYERLNELISADVLNFDSTIYTVLRGTDTLELQLNQNYEDFGYGTFLNINLPFKVGGVVDYSSADLGGLNIGDLIIEINGEEVFGIYDCIDLFLANSNDSVTVTISRSGELLEKRFLVDENGKIGFFTNYLIEPKAVKRSLFEASIDGIREAFSIVFVNFRALSRLVSGDVDPRKSLQGPVRISQIYGSKDGINWLRFFRITGLFLMLTLFFNCLPLPKASILEVIPLIYEIISSKPMSKKAFRRIQIAPIILIGLLMAFSIINDVFRMM